MKDKRSKMCRACWLAGFDGGSVKQCTMCMVTKPLSAFGIRTRKIPKPRSHCKECEAKAQRDRSRKPGERQRQDKIKRAWEQNNPEKHRRGIVRRSLRAKGCPEHKLETWVNRYLSATHCDICGQKPDHGRWKALHVDHCHQTGTIRGFLCNDCNLGLGKFRDSPVRLRNALNYLMRSSEKE